jgi:hypothetical protein
MGGSRKTGKADRAPYLRGILGVPNPNNFFIFKILIFYIPRGGYSQLKNVEP